MTTFAALSWNPNLQGILAVAVAVLLLCGSIYLLLATNTGVRLGLLIALAGLFGWMGLMGIVWTIYAQGLADQGRDPRWEAIEVNVGDLSEAQTERARNLDDWKALPAADPSRGEAQASADAALTGATEMFESNADYVTIGAFEIGGKPERTKGGWFNRAKHELSTMVRLAHPPHFAVVQVQAVQEVEVEEGEAPPAPEADPDQPVISVIMERDLGNVRVRPAVFTVLCLTIFGVLAWWLHRRDALATSARAAAEATA